MLCRAMTPDQPPAVTPAATHVDARGLRCPWPVLRLDRALRDGATTVDLSSDDPGAAAEVTAYAAERGYDLVVTPGGFRVSVR